MSDYSVVLGLQSTADWSDSNYIPGDYREAILRWYPNGEAPLTAMLSKLPSEVTDHYRFDWWTEGLPTQGAAITECYHDALLGTAYTETDGVAGDIIYAKFATEVLCKEFRVGHKVMFRDNSMPGAELVGKVVATNLNGASSYVAVKLLEADDASGVTGYDFDYLYIIGNMNPQASESVDAISYQPVNDYNYTNIWRTALEIAGTTLATKTRVGDWYQHEKQNALRMHSIEMEKDAFWGIRYLGTGTNGKPEYSTGGLIRRITTNRYYYTTDTDYAGKTWVQGGKDWLNTKLAAIFKYGSDTRMVYGGVGAILGLNILAETYGNIQLTVAQAEYGIKVMEWITPFGVIYLKRHPLFSYETADNYSMVMFEPKECKYRYMKDRDTHFRPDDRLKKGTWTDRDAIKEGWLTEGGFEWGIEPTFAYLRGVGQDNTV
jgi:hypothetical protein